MERDLRDNLTRETEGITQATSTLILKSPPENKIIVLTQPRSKRFNEISDVDTDTTLTGGFAAKAVIMLLEIST